MKAAAAKPAKKAAAKPASRKRPATCLEPRPCSRLLARLCSSLPTPGSLCRPADDTDSDSDFGGSDSSEGYAEKGGRSNGADASASKRARRTSGAAKSYVEESNEDSDS